MKLFFPSRECRFTAAKHFFVKIRKFVIKYDKKMLKIGIDKTNIRGYN